MAFRPLENSKSYLSTVKFLTVFGEKLGGRGAKSHRGISSFQVICVCESGEMTSPCNWARKLSHRSQHLPVVFIIGSPEYYWPHFNRGS